MEAFFALDGNILLWIQEHLRNPILTEILTIVTRLGDGGCIWILLAVVLLCFKKTRRAGAATALALLFSLLITNIVIKNVVARIRPYEVINGLLPLIPKPGEYSFPSGHTSSSFAAALAVWKNVPKKYGVAAVVLAVLISLSRLYVGVHYPTDVIGGIAAGAVSAYLAERVLGLIKKSE